MQLKKDYKGNISVTGWGIYLDLYLEEHKPTPNPSQEGNKQCPSWEGLGVGLNISHLH
jgi:hypothetical protein